jgi:vacuolar-type H+-ATPase subunit I/STV1
MTHVDKPFSQLAIDQVKQAINFAPGTVNSELVKQLFDRIDDLESEVQTNQNSIDKLRKTLEMYIDMDKQAKKFFDAGCHASAQIIAEQVLKDTEEIAK